MARPALRDPAPGLTLVRDLREGRLDRVGGAQVQPVLDREVADLNGQDDDGLGWSTLADPPAPALVRPGAMLLAGNRQARAVVRVVAVDEDGQVHFSILPGPVFKNRHLLDRTVA